MDFFCNFIWEQGFREKNEDSLCVRQMTKDGISYLLAVICDGIGGLSEGENASSYVVNSMLENMNALLKKKKISAGVIKRSFFRRLFQCHKTLLNYGREKQIRLGTTISMVFIVGKECHMFHVGDSAIFKGKRYLKRVTEIQQTSTGALLQAVGNGKNLKTIYKRFCIRKDMVILLASDGFYRKGEGQICSREWFKSISCDEKEIGERLIEIKNIVQTLGEKDNISAICIKVH